MLHVDSEFLLRFVLVFGVNPGWSAQDINNSPSPYHSSTTACVQDLLTWNRFASELDPTSEDNLKRIVLDLQNGIPKPPSFAEYHGQDNVKLLLKMHLRALFNDTPYPIREETIDILAKRSLGNPRILKQFSRHVIADQKVMKRCLESWEAEELLILLGIDERGLHPADRRVIRALIARENKPMGVAALASLANVSKVDLEQMIEPRLELCGFLERTPRGRRLQQVCVDEYSGKL